MKSLIIPELMSVSMLAAGLVAPADLIVVHLREVILEKLGILGDAQQPPPDTPESLMSLLVPSSVSHV